jgi:serine/threonine protein kinase
VDSAIPGALIADRYRLVRPLGAGGSATVWEASDTALDRTVAVKLLHGSALANPTDRERLRREARALARLAHPRITIVFDYLEQPQPDGTPQPVLVTELLSGSTLAERLRSGPLPAAEAAEVCAQLADALRAAHQAGIVHRDVKPANMVLTRGGVKLLDFGIAQAATDSNLTGNLAIGTPACMAPEQLTGRGATPASDVYALGCVLY